MKEPRITRAVRLSRAGIDAVQAAADEDGVSWSEAVRRLLKWATTPGSKKPQGWH